MDCSTPGFLVHHQLLELAQTHAHLVGDAFQPSHPLLSNVFRAEHGHVKGTPTGWGKGMRGKLDAPGNTMPDPDPGPGSAEAAPGLA